MLVHDYNGTGRWSRESILARYGELAQRMHVAEPLMPNPREHQSGRTKWIYPVMDRVIKGIERGDAACIEIGIEFIQEDQGFPFGKILKSNTARALRRADLTEGQRERIRKRVFEMLAAGYTPHEYREYAKLVRKTGFGGWWERVRGQLNLLNPGVRRWRRYFELHAQQHTTDN